MNNSVSIYDKFCLLFDIKDKKHLTRDEALLFFMFLYGTLNTYFDVVSKLLDDKLNDKSCS